MADGNENTVEVTRSGAYVKNLNFEDYIALGKLTQEQEELLREVMSDEFKNNLPSFGIGQDVANLARSKVGCQYSQENGMKKDTMIAVLLFKDVTWNLA